MIRARLLAADTLSLLGQLPGFVAGLISSALIAVPLYLRQKREAAASERRIILAIQQQQRGGELVPGSPAQLIASTISEATGRQEELLAEFKELSETLSRLVRERKIDSALPIAQPYTAVARALATQSAERQLGTPGSDLTLTFDAIRRTHASLFPRGYELAGTPRQSAVWVGQPGISRADATFLPPDASQVPAKLAELLDDWNARAGSLPAAPARERMRAIADFHHRFVSIHPFLDGNGIVARLLSARQMQGLFGAGPDSLESSHEYISALRSADQGNLEPLINYFDSQMASRTAG